MAYLFHRNYMVFCIYPSSNLFILTAGFVDRGGKPFNHQQTSSSFASFHAPQAETQGMCCKFLIKTRDMYAASRNDKEICMGHSHVVCVSTK